MVRHRWSIGPSYKHYTMNMLRWFLPHSWYRTRSKIGSLIKWLCLLIRHHCKIERIMWRWLNLFFRLNSLNILFFITSIMRSFLLGILMRSSSKGSSRFSSGIWKKSLRRKRMIIFGGLSWICRGWNWRKMLGLVNLKKKVFV